MNRQHTKTLKVLMPLCTKCRAFHRALEVDAVASTAGSTCTAKLPLWLRTVVPERPAGAGEANGEMPPPIEQTYGQTA